MVSQAVPFIEIVESLHMLLIAIELTEPVGACTLKLHTTHQVVQGGPLPAVGANADIVYTDKLGHVDHMVNVTADCRPCALILVAHDAVGTQANDTALGGQCLDLFVVGVASMLGYVVAGRMRENDGICGGLDGFQTGPAADVRLIDEHAHSVHLIDALLTEAGQTVVMGFEGSRADVTLLVIGQLNDFQTQPVQK